MADTTKVDEILARHRGLIEEGYDEYERKPISELGEVYANWDNQGLLDRGTELDKEGRRCVIILDELNQLGLSIHEKSKLSQSYKNLSVSIGGKHLDRKKDVAGSLIKARSGGGISALFQRQPPEGEGGKPQ
jgi:hypothetical protein